MPKGISLHIGLNYVDPDQYNGWDGELTACEFDAKDMAAIAKSRGFAPSMLLRRQATAKAVIEAIKSAAKQLVSGDTFLLTYSGHGGQVADRNADEGKFGDTDDRQDETWCLYDRELIDDELAALFAKFNKGVRILAFSDSCHSGSVTRLRPATKRRRGRPRRMPRELAREVYEKHRGLYDGIQRALKGSEAESIGATVILISGCQDNQTSADGDRNGYFTETLRKIWNKGKFTGTYRKFRDKIAAEMDEDQSPNYFVIGAANPNFEAESPFALGAKARSSRTRTRIAAPKRATRSRRGRAPIDVVLGALNDTGYGDPRGGPARRDSDITDWFRRVAEEDAALAVPKPDRISTFISVIGDRLQVTLVSTRLIRGDYATPQDIADLA
jgi:hypothetical protein